MIGIMWFVAIALLFSTTACKDEAPVIYKQADYKELVVRNQWLLTNENFDSPAYKEKFEAYYNEGLKNKDYTQSTDALLAVIQLMVSKGYYNNEYYYGFLKEYLALHAPEIEKDPLISFYIYKGMFETFSGKYEEAIQTLSNLDQFELTNFSNYLDLGYAHYYISCNHFYLGDYMKSLEELNNLLLILTKPTIFMDWLLWKHGERMCTTPPKI